MFLKNHCDIRLETAKKCSCMSRSPSRNYGKRLPEVVANTGKDGKLLNCCDGWMTLRAVTAKERTCQSLEHPPPCFLEWRVKGDNDILFLFLLRFVWICNRNPWSYREEGGKHCSWLMFALSRFIWHHFHFLLCALKVLQKKQNTPHSFF